MSGFPPPRPMGMPPMGMPPMQGYGYAPMGMMPMGMGMMPPMRPGYQNPSMVNNSNQKPNRKLIPQEIPKNDKDEKPPPTTVFVGNISERAPDAMVRQMLQRCGNVLSWKRVQGASGKLQAFGFCEYEDPEATLRCMRLLNEWEITDKKLVVKVDAKTKTLLDDYKTKKAAKDKKDKDNEGESDEVDEMAQREDRVAKAGLDAIMREYDQDLKKEPPPGKDPADEKKKEKKEERRMKEKKEEQPIKDQGLEDMGLEEDEKALINREIHKFRDAHKDEEPVDDSNKERITELRARREEMRQMERREREARKQMRDRTKVDRSRESREPPEKESRAERERERERSRSESRERERELMSRDRERDRRSWDQDEDDEDVYERRKVERKMREKEVAYQERLKNWEARERKRAREYDKDREKEDDRKAEEAREARRLREFLEDYVDERDDVKYYKGSALQRRLKEREKEIEMDQRDRTREKEELEEIRRRLEHDGHPDIEAEMAKIEREREEHLQPRMESDDDASPEITKVEVRRHSIIEVHEEPPEPPEPRPTFIAMSAENTMTSVQSQSSPDSDNEAPMEILEEDMTSRDEESNMSSLPGPAPKEETRLGFAGLKLAASESPTGSEGTPKRKKMTVEDVFNNDDEEVESAKRRKLEPINYAEDTQTTGTALKTGTGLIVPTKPATAEEKRRLIKSLIERIPTGKEELFAFSLDWTMVDTVLMDKRIKPWVNKKIVEYIGEEEPTLTNFICQKVIARTTPQQIHSDVAMVLDDEAEVFVVKMWRLLIYETEAKKLGLVK